jgi:hypothetical protein
MFAIFPDLHFHNSCSALERFWNHILAWKLGLVLSKPWSGDNGDDCDSQASVLVQTPVFSV